MTQAQVEILALILQDVESQSGQKVVQVTVTDIGGGEQSIVAVELAGEAA